jgi:hypothetical protein
MSASAERGTTGEKYQSSVVTDSDRVEEQRERERQALLKHENIRLKA